MAECTCTSCKHDLTRDPLVQADAEFCIKGGGGKPTSVPQTMERDIELKYEDGKQLKTKLEECISRFDTKCPKTMKSLQELNNYITGQIMEGECLPRFEMPHCPKVPSGQPYPAPHPYLPGVTLFAKQSSSRSNVLVTLDGRPAGINKPREYYHTEPPLNVPPWVLPRYKSQELRGGLMFKGCDCWKKNGLQDNCDRWDCGGRPECRTKPYPACPAGMAPPICGVRKPNYFDAMPPPCIDLIPPPPYPVGDTQKVMKDYVPNAPEVRCTLHEVCKH